MNCILHNRRTSEFIGMALIDNRDTMYIKAIGTAKAVSFLKGNP